jgi:hypothetical protein
VFDDPVSSFAYDYITNFCLRLRDFVLAAPEKRIVIFTHNWEFFVNVQSVLNGAQLNHHCSVQVLEACSIVAEYVEKPEQFKGEIEVVLAATNPLTLADKERLAGNMRRLIESIVNSHVFHGQRQQYKQRRHSASEFHHYTKLVPLLETEATVLRDLFGKLSVTEHDDPREAYVSWERAKFQNRYDSICSVESAVLGRK